MSEPLPEPEPAPPATRDYQARLTAAVEEAIDASPGDPAGLIAKELLARLLDEDPDLIPRWLSIQAEPLLAQLVSSRLRSRRATAPRKEVRQRFGDFQRQADGASQDTAEAYAGWTRFYEVRVEGVRQRRALRDMTASQLRQARDGLRQTARAIARESALLDIIEKRVAQAGPGKTVRDLYSDTDLERMFS